MVYGVVGLEGVFEQAPSKIVAEAWAAYEDTEQWPIKGQVALKDETGVRVLAN